MDDPKIEDRWRELDDLLGLPPAGKSEPPPAPAAPEPPPPPEPPAIKAYEEPLHLVAHDTEIDTPLQVVEDETPTVPMMREEEPVADWEADFDEEEDTSLDDQQEPETEEPGAAEEQPGEASALPGEEEKPRRGRRRRRRGRRRGGDKPDAEGQPPRPSAEVPAEPRPAPSRPTRGGDDDSRERHGRGRGKRRDEPEPRRPAPVHQERVDPDLEEMDDFENEQPSHASPIHDDTDFSNWSVPSWQELISSLHRPDR